MGKLASHSAFTRRSFMLSVAGASLCAAASSALNLIAGPANASNYRGVVGDIKPRATDSGLVDMIRLLPEGIGVIPVFLNLSEGTREEYGNGYGNYERNIAYLASQKCNVICIEGAPPFMILGPAGEAKMKRTPSLPQPIARDRATLLPSPTKTSVRPARSPNASCRVNKSANA